MPGVLVSQVIYVKHGEDRDFLILDAAMNDLVRPAMYGAHHDIVPLIEAAPGAAVAAISTWSARSANRATPSSKGAELPGMAAGDLVAFRSAGAYGAVMASRIQFAAPGARGAGRGRSIRRHPGTADL